jgi:hypothetical protein
MSRNGPSHSISGVFVFLLLGIFALFSTVLVLLGAKSYRSTVDKSEAHNNARIASSYIRSMLRADDEIDVLQIEDIEGVKSISMINDYGFESYVTRLYVYEGNLREWFAGSDIPFDPHGGETVCPADSMEAEIKDGLLTVVIHANDMESVIHYAPRAVAP